MPDVALCDVFLPDGNGVDLVTEMKKKSPGVEIILLTAHGNIPDGVQAIKNGAFDYITKGDDNNKIIGIDNDFMKAYIDIADNVNACTLYRDVSHSYYNDNVIGDIVDNYINKGISKDKFIRQLSAATEIYLTE